MNSDSDFMVGVLAAFLVLLIGVRIFRGLQAGRIPIYRTYLDRDQDPAKFNLLVALHVASMLIVGAIAADLLFALNLKGR